MTRTEVVWVRDSSRTTYARPIDLVDGADNSQDVPGNPYGAEHQSFVIGDGRYEVFDATTGKVFASIDAVDSGDADAFMTALLARLSGTVPGLTSGYSPQTKTLTLIEGADYASGAIPGPLEIPLPANDQYEGGDTVWLNRRLGYSREVQPQWNGTIVVADGSAVARFTNVSPSNAGKGEWEIWHKNNAGNRWMPTGGPLNVVDAIQPLPAGV